METFEIQPSHRDQQTDKLLPGPGILVSRGLIYTIVALLAAAGVWAWVTETDVVIEAPGQLVVKGEPIQVTPPESGLVVAVPVKVGDHVNRGDVLLQLDAHRYTSEERRVLAEIDATRVEENRYRQGAEAMSDVQSSIKTEYETTRNVVDLIRKEHETLRSLQRTGASTLAEVQRKEHELLDAKGRLARLEAECKRNRNDAAERLHLAVEAEARIKVLSVRIAQLREQQKRATILAPVAGTVTHLAVVHPGSVIHTSEPAVVIVPDDQPLMARIEIPNASMRRLRKHLTVRMEFAALPYEDYGYAEGTLVDIEPDADDTGNYKAWVSLDRQEFATSTLLEQLKPGLMTEARIVIKRQRITDYLLKPIKRLAKPVSVSG